MKTLTTIIALTKCLTINFARPWFVIVLFASMKSKMAKLTNNFWTDLSPSETRIQELLRQNALKDRLLSILAHDVRSPLYSLQSLLSLLSGEKIDPKELPRISRSLDSQVTQLLQFIDNILRWTKNNTDQLKPKFEQLVLYPLVKETTDLLLPLATRKQIYLRSNVSRDTAVFADSEMIKLVLRNLVTNSIKFCHSGDSIYIKAEEQKNMVLISVQDTGPGISNENIPRLFSVSHLTTKGTKNEIGFGLGLTLCREFVEKMGGNISASSAVGKGSRFEFTVHSPTSASPSFQQFIEMQEK